MQTTQSNLILPKMAGTLLMDGRVELLEEPIPIPGTNKLSCLANVEGNLCLVELSLKFLQAQ